MIFCAVAALQAVALVLAAWRRPLPRVLLALTAYSLADELLLEALHAALDGAPRPFTGLHLAGYHASVGLVIGWPAVIAAGAWLVFSRPGLFEDKARENTARERINQPVRAWGCSRALDVILCAWLIAAGGLAACYPLPRGWTAPVLHAAEVLFVVAALAAIPVGWKRRTIATPEGQAVGLLVAVELTVALVGAWATGSGVFSHAQWDRLARLPYLLGWLTLCCMLLRWSTRPSSSPAR